MTNIVTYPTDPVQGQEFTVGETIKIWDGEKWVNKTPTNNPHNVTKSQVGLGDVDNVSAANLRDRSTHAGTQPLSTINDAGSAASKDVGVSNGVASLDGSGKVPDSESQVSSVSGKKGDVELNLSDIKVNGGTANNVVKAQLIGQGLSGNYGFFEEGFTYSVEGDIGIDADGNSWIYVGDGAPNKVVTAGTVPSAPDYQQVTFNVLPAQNVTNANGGSVQDFIDGSIREASLSEAIAEDAPVGTRYKITGRGDWIVNSVGTTSDDYINLAMTSGRVLSLEHKGISYPNEFGWIGDGITPQADVVEFTFNYGKPIDLNVNGTWLLEREISMPANQIIVTGLGRFPVYPYEFSWYTESDKLPTFLVAHNGSDGFRFSKNSSARGSILSGFNIIKSQGSQCIRAFGFDLGGDISSGPNYGYDITLRRMGVFDFVSAFDTYLNSPSVEPTIADITIDDCCINRNDHTFRTLNGTAVNMLKFTNNKAGQQTIGGINVMAHSFTEYGNLFEGTPNPVKVKGAYEGLNVGASYFEANSGVALYQLESSRGPSDIRPCTILATSIPPVVASNASEIRSVYPLVGEGMYNAIAPFRDGTVNSLPEIDTLTTGISSCDTVSDKVVIRPRSVISETYIDSSTSADLGRGVSPLSGLAMLTQKLQTSSVATSFNLPLTATAFHYVTISFMIKHTASDTPSTYVTVDINGNNAVGSRDYDFSEESLHISGDSYKVYSVTVRPQVAMNSVVLRVYPYGVGSAAGKSFEIAGITAYSTEFSYSAKPFVNTLALESVSTQPATGNWLTSDRFTNNNPSAGGQGSFIYIGGTGWVYS